MNRPTEPDCGADRRNGAFICPAARDHQHDFRPAFHVPGRTDAGEGLGLFTICGRCLEVRSTFIPLRHPQIAVPVQSPG